MKTDYKPWKTFEPGKKVVKSLFAIALFLLIAHLVVLTLVRFNQNNSSLVRELDHFFNLNNEQNFPTFFSSAILLFASALLFIIYKLNPTDRFYWLLLALVFLFLSLDEAVEIHEKINTVISQRMTDNLSGFLFWAWIIPYSILFLALGIVLFKFVFRLPKDIRNTFIIGGIIFFTGAVLIESLEGHIGKIYKEGHIAFEITIASQEFIEMCGVIIFIYGLLKYMSNNIQSNNRQYPIKRKGSISVFSRTSVKRVIGRWSSSLF